MKQVKLIQAVRGVFGIMFVIAVLDTCWVAVFYMTESYYGSSGWYPNVIIRSIINSTLAFLMFGLLMFVISLFARKRHFDVFRQINEALKRISKGDFNVNLRMPGKFGDHAWTTLFSSFNQMAVDLGQMEKMRQEFISNVSHEIQSPLTSISGFARALQSESLSREERLHYLTIIETESKRLSKLSDSLLKLASLESDHHPFEPKRYRLDKQLRNIVLACEPQWLDKSIEMDIQLEEAYITADEDLISQAWVNLLNNSIKFTPEGGTIGVSLRRRSETELTVRISDTGIGIAEGDLPHIFERFYKADKSRNRAVGGSGLGLAITRKIVEMHKGDISVESRVGEGTRFTVTLPVEQGVAADHVEEQARSEAVTASTLDDARHPAHRKRHSV